MGEVFRGVARQGRRGPHPAHEPTWMYSRRPLKSPARVHAVEGIYLSPQSLTDWIGTDDCDQVVIWSGVTVVLRCWRHSWKPWIRSHRTGTTNRVSAVAVARPVTKVDAIVPQTSE